MAEFTLINRRKNLIFLQSLLLLPFEVSALELQTLQAGMAMIDAHKSTWIHKRPVECRQMPLYTPWPP